MDANPAAASPPSRHGATLLATGLGLFMIFLDATIVNVALPDIQTEFRVGENSLQWAVAAYSLTMGMFMMASASAGDRLGRRRTYIIGIIVFGTASLGCALAPSIVPLNVARGFQGVGAAIVNVSSLALVGAAFTDPAAKAKAIGAWTGIAAVGLAIGPSLGGVLTDSFGWRSVFAINPIIAVVTIVATLAFVAESKDPKDRGFDWVGQVLFIVTIGLLTFALIQGPAAGWLSPQIVGCFAGAVAGGVLFVVLELRSASPMMDVRVFRDRVYSAAILTVFAVLFGIYGSLLIITQYLQNVRGYSAENAGLLLLAMTVPTVIAAPTAGRIVARVGARIPVLCGVASITTGLAVLALTTGGNIGFTLVGLALVGVAGGLAVTPATSIAMGSIEPERSGMASGILSVQRALGSTAGFAIMGSILAATVASVLPSDFASTLPSASERSAAVSAVVQSAEPNGFVALIGPSKPLPINVSQEQTLLAAADSAFVTGIRLAMAAGFVVTLFAFVVGFRVFPHGERATEESELDEAEALDAEG